MGKAATPSAVEDPYEKALKALKDAGPESFLQTLHGFLKTKYDTKWDGVGFALTLDNNFGSHLVAQTPGLWGKEAKDYETGTSKDMVSRIKELIKSAENFIDIMTLAPLPDGKFMNGIQEGLEVLARSRSYVRVRILAGVYPGLPQKNPSTYLKELVTRLKTQPGNLEICVAAQRKLASWNHAKIVAVDGDHAIVGGQNMWDSHYLGDTPVHDLNVELSGSAAYPMHLFADEIWKDVRLYKTHWKPAFWKSGATEPTTNCLAKSAKEYLGKRVPQHGTNAVLGAGRFGPFRRDVNPADQAMLLSLGSAQKEILIAQQNLGFTLVPGNPRNTIRYWEPAMKALAQAMVRGCQVKIVLSNDGAKSGGSGTPYSCATIAHAAETIKHYVKAELVPPNPALLKVLRWNLRLAALRFGPSKTWTNKDKYKFANHAKFFMVDNKVFYVGSKNLYPCDLIEYGVFISDRGAVKKIREEYWDQLWKYSGVTAQTWW